MPSAGRRSSVPARGCKITLGRSGGLGGSNFAADELRVGEVIEATTSQFVAQSYSLHNAPAFGSLVRASDGEISVYAVTADTSTGSVDPGRRPVARRRDESSEEELYRNNPELFELLRTEFTAVVVGFRDRDEVHQYIPPRTPHIHSFVYECAEDEVFLFARRLDFLATLNAGAQKGQGDELIAACIRRIAAGQKSDETARAFLVRAGKELAVLLGSDISRLNGVLRRMRA